MREDVDPLDEITIAARLREKGKLEMYGGLVYLAELIDVTPVMANCLVYAEIVVERWKAREAIEAAREMAEAAYTGGVVGKSADRIRALLRHLDGEGFAVSPPRIGDLANEFDAWFQDPDAAAFRTRTWCGLDDILGGIPEDRPMVVAARTGNGKSALMLQIARRNAEHGIPVLLIDLEMGARITAGRALAGASGLSGTHLLHKDREGLDMFSIDAYRQALAAMQGLPLRVLQPHGALSIDKLDSAVRRSIADDKTQLVLIDHLVRLDAPGIGDYERQTNRMRAIVRLQKETGIPHVVAAQINREGEEEPQLRHLKGSGEIEENAAAVILLHDPSPHANSEHEIKGIVAKNGNGRRGYKLLRYSPATFTMD